MANEFSLTSLLSQLSTTNDPVEQSTIIAEAAIDQLPTVFAHIARRCIILRWFDTTIIQALLLDNPDNTVQSEDVSIADSIYQILVTLPFIEKLAWGLAYHEQTRKGLISRYETAQPDMLKEAAAVAAPAYLKHNNKALAQIEAFFCYFVAGKKRQAMELFEQLLLQAGSRRDWDTILALFQTQEQAESLPFVTKIELSPLYEQIRSTASYARGDQTTASESHTQSLAYLDQGELTDVKEIFKLSPYNQEKSIITSKSGNLPLATLVKDCQGQSNDDANHPSCTEIIYRASQGDQEALVALLEISKPIVERSCPPNMRGMKEDIIQEVNLRLIHKFRNQASPYKPSTFAAYHLYLKLTTRAVILDIQRSKSSIGTSEQLHEEQSSQLTKYQYFTAWQELHHLRTSNRKKFLE